MLSRREVLTSGVVGSLAAQPAAHEQDRDVLERIDRSIQSGTGSIARVLEGPSLAHGPIPKLRELMRDHLRTNSKFPDFIDIGINHFYDLYDWHIRHQQQLVVTRQADGRYMMQFMFTMLVLRHEVDPNYISVPYDKA